MLETEPSATRSQYRATNKDNSLLSLRASFLKQKVVSFESSSTDFLAGIHLLKSQTAVSKNTPTIEENKRLPFLGEARRAPDKRPFQNSILRENKRLKFSSLGCKKPRPKITEYFRTLFLAKQA